MVSNSKTTEATEKFKHGFGILRILQFFIYVWLDLKNIELATDF